MENDQCPYTSFLSFCCEIIGKILHMASNPWIECLSGDFTDGFILEILLDSMEILYQINEIDVKYTMTFIVIYLTGKCQYSIHCRIEYKSDKSILDAIKNTKYFQQFWMWLNFLKNVWKYAF